MSSNYVDYFTQGFTTLVISGNLVGHNIAYANQGDVCPRGYIRLAQKKKVGNSGDTKERAIYLSVYVNGYNAKRILEKCNPGDEIVVTNGEIGNVADASGNTSIVIRAKEVQIKLRTKKSIEAAKQAKQARDVGQPQAHAYNQQQPQAQAYNQQPVTQHPVDQQQPPMDFDDDIPF